MEKVGKVYMVYSINYAARCPFIKTDDILGMLLPWEIDVANYRKAFQILIHW
ncbi:MAG: hypothetical protein ACI4A7_08485 [Prevotella sp.]